MSTEPAAVRDVTAGNTQPVPAKVCRQCRRQGEWPGQPCPLCVAGITPTTPAQAAAARGRLESKLASYRDDQQRGQRRVAELEVEVSEAQRKLDVARELAARAQTNVANTERALQLLAEPDVKVAVAAPKPAYGAPSTTDVRRAVVQMEAFTLAEFQAVLNMSEGKAREALKGEVDAGIVRPSGRKFQHSIVYEYVPATDPGEAFRSQQARREAVDATPERDYLPVAGTGEGLLYMLSKDVRKVARMAIRDGWSLTATGGGHAQLIRGGERLTFATTPKNPSADAKRLTERLRRGYPKGDS